MRKRIIVGNWKMHPTTLEEANRLFRSIKNISNKLVSTHIIICPPFIYIPSLIKSRASSTISIGAQDVFFEEQGSFTGEISPLMLKNIGITHVIVGHSEKRELGDTDEMISKKIQSLLEVGIHPILCVGEKVRDEHGEYLEVLKTQIKNSLNKVPKKYIKQLIVAYEPIWAIGAKEPMDPETVHEMSIFVKKVLSDIYGHDEAIATPVLYGGAINFRNAGDIIILGQVDGLLVGRESVNRQGFSELLKTIDSL
ncbi:MAG: triose-phosphate isomerase [Patescibacteria group bacterium]